MCHKQGIRILLVVAVNFVSPRLIINTTLRGWLGVKHQFVDQSTAITRLSALSPQTRHRHHFLSIITGPEAMSFTDSPTPFILDVIFVGGGVFLQVEILLNTGLSWFQVGWRISWMLVCLLVYWRRIAPPTTQGWMHILIYNWLTFWTCKLHTCTFSLSLHPGEILLLQVAV